MPYSFTLGSICSSAVRRRIISATKTGRFCPVVRSEFGRHVFFVGVLVEKNSCVVGLLVWTSFGYITADRYDLGLFTV